ncbi:phosphocholine-specific phospholipase C [Paucibacter sp. Y2R2-4]|uniref:phosphocholine-specific phospholipase C n=1 Tax=Paucibacter sp. Y2R2-4 TaxID=2893553 RepID=UPI0021E5134C|nr:phospholipase C, phosphocholine-specific [Paucibacter sp. Y2R2-4]MCV2349568.1 phospholipase C, phosphocholine-specific [Paucibacter sp. Y2R2-4]
MSAHKSTRRGFMAASALGLASSPSFAKTIARALATPANQRSGGIGDIEHIVFLMQENRSFDHYFGALAGVRGFNDPRAITLPSGKPVWYQPSGASHVLPYHFDIKNTNALRVGLNHSWKGSEAAWKDWNAWVPKKSPRTMGYFDRADLPFYYALADAFTTCDAYHCSVFGPTDPNRFYALSGHAGGVMTGISDSALYNVTNGIYNADIANDSATAKGIEWQSYAEVLEANQISWKVYQEWDNYGDNYLQYFKNFRVDAQGRKLTPDSPLYQKCRAMAPGSNAGNAKGTTGQYLIDAFAADVKAGRLPAVSWICAPTEYCEHPEETPNAGENFSARLLAALVDNPEIWSKTALVITYDENDGFFDHMPSTMPPLDANRGRSTVANSLQGEVYAGTEPIGLGPRVPTLVISPWSKGGRVNSQLFDHTSLIRFVEEWLVQGKGLPRSAVQCAAISPWRRAVCGDLRSAFNFAEPNKTWPAGVPRSANYFKNWGSKDALPPAVQTLPRQERVTTGQPRPACAMPYRAEVDGAVQGTARQFALSFGNAGSATDAFIVYSALRSDGPWHYTVEPSKRIEREVWNWTGDSYQLNVHGQNGFVREFIGSLGTAARLGEVSLREDPAARSVRINFSNGGTQALRFKLQDLAYGDRSELLIEVPAGQTRSYVRTLDYSQGWYDLGVTLEGEALFWRRLAGHLEGAGLDYTDPVLNGLAQAAPSPVPGVLPPPVNTVKFSASTGVSRIGDSLNLSWQGLPAGSKHWLGFYRKGMTPGGPGSLKWNYVAAPAGSQSFSLAGFAEGEYFFGLFLNDGYEEAAPRLNLRLLKRGDINGDGRIDAADRDAQRAAMGSCVGDTRYQPLANFDADNCITQADYRGWYEIFSKQ